MIELGELEKRQEEFAKRHVRVVVVSNDSQAIAQKTQTDFPHLVVVADDRQSLAIAIGVLHPGMGPGGEDTNAPTTFLVDGSGNVRWWSRNQIMVRLSPEEVLEAVDKNLTAK
jgi:alkyl hydroperoxide reductase subunit AhpC